jgi:pimeloyl-ACP methyl ester carboxylesterase
MERRYFSSSFGKVSYLFREGKNPIIFLHGLGGTGNTWIKLSTYLDESYALYMLDLLGHGRSEKPKLEYTIEVQEKVLDEFINEIGGDIFSLVGNSYGGWVSMRFTVDVRKPEYLVLEDTAGINVTFGEMPEYFRKKMVQRLIAENDMNSETVIENIISNNSNPKWKMKQEELAGINSKTLIIWGSDDTVIPVENGMELWKAIKGSKFVEIEKGRHVPHLSEPKLVAAAIDDFFKTGY